MTKAEKLSCEKPKEVHAQKRKRGLTKHTRCCNGCKRRGGYGCTRKPKAFYRARLAQEAADRELSEARRGLDEDEGSMGRKLSVIRGAISRGLSPAPVSAC